MPFVKSISSALLSLSALALVAAPNRHPRIRSADSLNAFFANANKEDYAGFSITGTVQHTIPNSEFFILRDSTGRTRLARGQNSPHVKVGDKVFVTGIAGFSKLREPFPYTEELTVLEKSQATPVAKLRIEDLDERTHNLAIVQVSGIIIDIFDDEVDKLNCFLLLKDGDDSILLAYPKHNLPPQRHSMIDASVRVCGIYMQSPHGLRKFPTPIILIDNPKDLEILHSAPANPFDVPLLESQLYLSPKRIASIGRRKVRGQVIATWNEDCLLVREKAGRVIKIELSQNTLLPKCNALCEFVGYPQTDMYRINLTKALCRDIDETQPQSDLPEKVSALHIITNNWHLPSSDELYHGHLIRIKGTVRSIPNDYSKDKLMILDNEGVQVPVDISSNPTIAHQVSLDCTVNITGICLLDTENKHAGNPFPQIKGFTLIPRGPDDVEIIKRPPWWTTGRLLAVLGVILALLGGIVIWNVMLRRMVERRSRELDRERHAHEQTEARAADRNRLAIELHDLISQSLTGATMQIESIGDLLALDQKKALQTLNIVARTLKSCKQELRNCIWDLRNNALDERHFTRAIRKSLELHSGDAEIRIQCDVLRSKLSDNTAHAILCIIRELVANAIHHGKAKSIEIVGTVQGDDLSFSVTDDGCGFDTARRPGIAEGHFGLQGVEERLDKLSGRMTIQSKINEGTRVSIWIKSEC